MNPIKLWWLSLGLFGAVVAVVAGLLGLIVTTAKGIERVAGDIWIAGKQIAGNTVSIWMLQQTNEQLAEMLDSARTLERTTAAIDDTLGALAGRVGERG